MIGLTLGPYRIEQELGIGGMGKVYLATTVEKVPGVDVDRKVALKVVHPHLLETRGFFKRFLLEAEVGKQVRHENVVRTYDADALRHEGEQFNFLVMEYVEGQTLRDLLQELERVPEELCRHIGREIAKALGAIHGEGIVHRDLKPENVLITEDHVVKVMDLGVARLQEEAVRLSQTGAFVGSLHYAAPEQLAGESADLDGRADLHSLGLVLYELASAVHPFMDEDFRKVMVRIMKDDPRRLAEINPQLSPFFEEVVHTLLAKDRDERFADATELLAVLETGESGEWWNARAQALRVETKQPLRRIHVPRETALYGRDEELARLRSAYDRASAGEGQVLLVEGEAGIGKTRLVDEFVGQLRQNGEDVNFLFGSYPPGGAATMAGAFSTAYREHFGEAGLEETLRGYLTVTPTLIPSFAALLVGDSTPKGEEPLTKDSLQTVFVHATRALAAERTTIVLIDDIHYAPEDGRAVFASLALAVPGHRILLIGTTQPGLAEDWVTGVERQDHSGRITLRRLGGKDVANLLADTFRSERLVTELGLQIIRKSDGNPLFVFELIRGLREGKYITQEQDGAWASTQVINDIQIPSSVIDLIEARIVDIDEESRDLLDMASCLGFQFDPGLVADAVGMGRIPALKRLGRIEKKHRLIRSSGRNFTFDHNQVQEALYKGLPEMLREEYHAVITDVLETREGAADKDPGDLDGTLCVALCEHAFRGARGERALRYLDAALEHLVGAYLNEEALELSDRALAAKGLLGGERRMEILLGKAGHLDALGRRDEQRKALDEALALAEAGGDPHAITRVQISLGGHLQVITRYKDADEVLRRALERSREMGDEKTLAEATRALGTSFRRVGRLQEARVQFENSVAHARNAGDRLTESRAMGELGNILRVLGKHEEGLEQIQRARAAAREAGDRRWESASIGYLAIALHAVGRYEDARAVFERHVTLAREAGHRQHEAVSRFNLGEMLGHQGDLVQARTDVVAATALAREIGFNLIVPHAESTLARIDGAEGKGEEALSHFEKAVELARDLGLRDFVASTLVLVGEAIARERGPDEARPRFQEALAIAKETGAPGPAVLASCHLALLPGGDPAPALAAFTESEARLGVDERMEARFLLWKSTGDAIHLAESHGLLDRILAHAPADRREPMLTNVPLNRDIDAAWKEHGS